MKKKSSIVTLSIVGVIIVIGLILSFVSFPVGRRDFNSFAGSIKLGLDLKGGVSATYEAVQTDSTVEYDAAVSGTVTRLQSMLVSKGYTEAQVYTEENNTRITVEVPDVDNPAAVLTLIGEPAEVVFRAGQNDPSGDVIVGGKNVKSAKAGYDQAGSPVVSLEFDKDGGDAFAKYTDANVGGYITIYKIQDDVQETNPVSTATINEAITGGKAQISMTGGTYESASNLADQIMSGTFALELSLLTTNSIEASLGAKALRYSLIAGAIGFILVIAFLIWRYRMLGVAGAMALLGYLALMMFFLAVLPWVQLTLPGIAGILLSIGMAVDGNIIIYERMRDEYASGKSILASYYAGFKKALSTILDSNITTIIAAVVLIIFGGSVLGFGVTLLIGILLSMFSSLLMTRLFVKCFINLDSNNPALYNFKRKDNVEEIPDDFDKKNDEAEEVPAVVTETIQEGASN